MTAVSASGQPLGVVEWFRPGDEERVVANLERMKRIGVERLRTHLSWADFHIDQGRWYDWLFPTLGKQVEILPCVHYTPPSLSVNGKSSGPPRRSRDYADFIDLTLDRYGRWFEWVELWNEPNNLNDWDWRYDPEWRIFCTMIQDAAYWTQARGWKTVLGGPCPTDLNWLRLIGERGALHNIDAIGLHGFPGTWEAPGTLWQPWETQRQEIRELVEGFRLSPEIWLTEVGYSSWRHDQTNYLHWLLDAIDAPVDRVYWYMLQDIDPAVPTQDGLQFDPRHYHFGLYYADGTPKLAARIFEGGGVEAVRKLSAIPAAPAVVARRRPVLVTGGAGFIGSNLANALASDGTYVLVFDSLNREGAEENLDWLCHSHPKRVSSILGDLRDVAAVEEAVGAAEAVFHFAAQVAVTTSIHSPRDDFEVNAGGTLNILEAARQRAVPPPVIFASTNKVYGDLSEHRLELVDDRWMPADAGLRARGVSETQPLRLCTPYGCSKGVADQYVLDFGRTFGVPTAVLRMSCIYGPRQFGTEDQGWVAHFLIRARTGAPITVFGDGRQVRDILHVEDAVAAYRLVLRHIDTVGGRMFNLGGGPVNAVSLLDVIGEIERLLGGRVRLAREEARTGDQRYYVSDTGSLTEATGWRPRVGWRSGLRDLAGWLDEVRPFPGDGQQKAIA